MNQRDLTIFFRKKECLSYILAVLVFIIHINTLSNYQAATGNADFQKPLLWFQTTICYDAVPCFFILSGVLFFRNFSFAKYLEKIKKRISTLLIPYLVWNTIWFLFDIIVSLFFSRFLLNRKLVDFSFSGILRSILYYGNNGPFWFICNLIIFIIFSPIAYFLLKNKYLGIISIAATLFLTYSGYTLPLAFSVSVVYYLVGAYIGLHCFDWFTAVSREKTIIGITGIIICILLLSWVKGLSANLIVYTCLLVFYALCLIFAFDCFPYAGPPPKFVSHSFWVYAMHVNTSGIVTKLLYFALPKTVLWGWINLFATIGITLLLIEITASSMAKFSPPLYKILSGNR